MHDRVSVIEQLFSKSPNSKLESIDQLEKDVNALKNKFNQSNLAKEEAKVPEPQELQRLIDEERERQKLEELYKDHEALKLKVNQLESSLIKQPMAQPKSKAENHLEFFRQQWPVQLKDDSYLQKALNANMHQTVADLIDSSRL